MLSDSWSCIMTQNGPGIVSDEIRLTLKAAACQLYAQKVERALIRSNHCGGIIQTEWKTATLGTRTGMVFKSQLEGDQGEYFVNFLLGVRDLEAGEKIIREMEEGGQLFWSTLDEIPDIPDLYRFNNLRREKMN